MTERDEHVEILEARARALARPVAEPVRDLEQLLVVEVTGHLLAVPLARVRAVLAPCPLAWVPDAPSAVVGVREVGGRLVAVADPRALLGLAGGGEIEQPHVVVLEDQTEPLGLLIERPVTTTAWSPPPASPSWGTSDVVAGIVRDGSDDVVVLDCDVIVTDMRAGATRTRPSPLAETGAG